MSESNIYKILQDIFKNVWEQQKYAEVKNGLFLTFQVGVFYFVMKSFILNKDINLNSYFEIGISLLFIINIIISLYSFKPKLENDTWYNQSQNDEIKNIFFFESIKHYREDEYIIEVAKKIESDETIEDGLKDLTNQIITLSKITSNKFYLFKVSFFLFLFNVFIVMLAFGLGVKSV